MSTLELSADELLMEVAKRRIEVVIAQQTLEETIEAAREAGASWSEIGVALDTSKQNAHRKYGMHA